MTLALVYTLCAVFAISLLSLIGVLFISFSETRIRTLLLVFVGVAVGALLGDAFIHLIPEASESLGQTTFLWVLAGMGVFFVLEKILHWHHHHEVHKESQLECHDCDDHVAPFGKLIIVSDALHNVVDGVIIAAGFLVSPEVGIATTIAVALHELPQEIGDFGVLLHAGFTKKKALIANFASALSAFIGVAAVFIIGNSFESAIPVFSALAAGAFIYIAAADLVPELHKTPTTKESLIQLSTIVFGVLLMLSLTLVEAHAEPALPDSATVETSARHVTLNEPSERYPLKEKAAQGAAFLVRIIDGDTVVVQKEGKEIHVRMIGIDAPEMNTKSRTPDCYAQESKEMLSVLLGSSTLTLVKDATQDEYDRYGRLLAYIFVGERNSNDIMIKEGAAKEYTYKNRAYTYQSSFKESMEFAELHAKGLWGKCK